MNKRIDSQHLFAQLKSCVRKSQLLALSLNGKTCLSMEAQELVDLGLIPLALETTTKYFSLKPGEMVMLNDPYSGGSGPMTLTVIGAITKDFFAVDRIGFRNHGTLRIPPTPVQPAILEILKNHPESSKDFEILVPEFIKKFETKLQNLKTSRSFIDLQKSIPRIHEALTFSQQIFSDRLREMPSSEAIDEIHFQDHTKIRLKTSIKHGDMSFDFSGTSAPLGFGINDRATAGVCLSSLLKAIQFSGPVHSKLFDCLKIQTPQNSIVNAKFPFSLELGLTEGARALSVLVLRTLRHLDRSLSTAENCTGLCTYKLKFESGKSFSDHLLPGTGASDHCHGTHGVRFLESVENIEQHFPLRFHTFNLRKNSGGGGEYLGGLGQTKVIEVLENGHLDWSMLPYHHSPEGVQGGQAGSLSEIALIRKGHHDLIHLPYKGLETVFAGDRIILQTGGGGGFGEVQV